MPPEIPRRWYRTTDGRAIHRLRAENALGKALPNGAEVHHADGTRSEYSPLVICENRAYHELLHVRMRIKAAGGNPNTDKVCRYCGVKPRTAFNRNRQASDGLSCYCRSCLSAKWRRSHAAA